MALNKIRAFLLAIAALVAVGCEQEPAKSVAVGEKSTPELASAARCHYFYVDVFNSLFPLPDNMVAETWDPDRGDSTLSFVSRDRAGQVADPSALARAKFTLFANEREKESVYPTEHFELVDSKVDGDIQSWTYRIKQEAESPGAAPARSSYSFVASSSRHRVEILSSNPKLGRALFEEFLKLRATASGELPMENACIGL
jgi:hypothetical protein